jgi:hypothetical protein
MDLRRVVAVFLSVGFAACEGEPTVRDAGDAAPVALRHPPRACARDDEAALPDGAGGLRCVVVGASLARTAADLPDPRALDPALPEPVRWVRAGAAPGDGSRARPFATLAQALASLPPAGGTVALAAGRHAVTSPVAVRGAVAIVGAGATHAALAVTDGASAFTVRAGARLTLRDLSVEHPAADTRAGSTGDVDAAAGGAVALRDVLFSRPQSAVVVAGAGTRLVADGVTVRLARGRGVAVLDGARATLRDALLRDGADVGVLAAPSVADGPGGSLQLADALVAANAAGGVSLAGRLDAMAGADCDAADLAAGAGDFDCLLRVAVTANGAAGVTVADRRIALVRRSYVAATRTGGGAAGDGLVVTRGAHLRLDDDLAALDPMTALGRGTQVLANARAGVLADLAGTAFRANGALIGSNGGPGVVLQRGAHAPAFDACVVSDNAGAGLAVSTGASVAAILCDQFVYTRAGAVAAGDGLSVYGGSVDAARDNVLSNNARFGLVLSGASPFTLPAIELLRNRGADNGFGAGVYGAPRIVFDGPDRITGRSPAPASDPGGASEAL